MLPENIVQLALKSRKKGLTAKEREVLDQWLLENVELQEEFHQLVECGSVVQAARLFEDIQIRDACGTKTFFPTGLEKTSFDYLLECCCNGSDYADCGMVLV